MAFLWFYGAFYSGLLSANSSGISNPKPRSFSHQIKHLDGKFFSVSFPWQGSQNTVVFLFTHKSSVMGNQLQFSHLRLTGGIEKTLQC